MASKLSQKQLETRTFILQVFKKEIDITTTVFKRFMKVYSDVNNQEVTKKYGENLFSSLLSVYKFKNQNDYIEKMNLFKTQGFYDSSLTVYGQFHSIITKKLFDNPTIKTEWILSSIGDNGSVSEINHIISYIFIREKADSEQLISTLLKDIKGSKREHLIYDTLLRNIIERDFRNVDIVETIISQWTHDLDIHGFSIRFKQAKNKNKDIMNVIGVWLHSITGDESYLPENISDIFLF